MTVFAPVPSLMLPQLTPVHPLHHPPPRFPRLQHNPASETSTHQPLRQTQHAPRHTLLAWAWTPHSAACGGSTE